MELKLRAPMGQSSLTSMSGYLILTKVFCQWRMLDLILMDPPSSYAMVRLLTSMVSMLYSDALSMASKSAKPPKQCLNINETHHRCQLSLLNAVSWLRVRSLPQNKQISYNHTAFPPNSDFETKNY